MRRLLLAGFLVPLVSAQAPAESHNPSTLPPAGQCGSAIGAAEQGGAIPDHLLAAIGQVESGRRDPVTGRVDPWPWTINVEGQGFFYESKADAIAAVRALQTRGIQSIDVGCMQVNLMHHRDAFASLEQAFDPAANTQYAAHFLNQLRGQTKDWQKAAALYHSATPEFAADYARKVLAAWTGDRQSRDGRAAEQFAILHGSAPSNRVAVTLPPGPRENIRIIPLAGAGPGPHGRGPEPYRAVPISVTARTHARNRG
ncbi:MAG: transglycosylase SLT domain-containing protein [Acetobacteraceae bacterium]|nr:transglycosylase SLT domain-containing protein [Acetobacteraceae bacterium]